MAKTKSEENYVVPLRKDFVKVPKYRRAKRAVSKIRSFMKRHMKAERILIGKALNDLVWSKGIKNPPSKVEVTALRRDDDSVFVELQDVVLRQKEEEAKAKEKEKKSKKKEAKTQEQPVQEVEEEKAELAEKKEDKSSKGSSNKKSSSKKDED